MNDKISTDKNLVSKPSGEVEARQSRSDVSQHGKSRIVFEWWKQNSRPDPRPRESLCNPPSTFNNGKVKPLWTEAGTEKTCERRHELLREFQVAAVEDVEAVFIKVKFDCVFLKSATMKQPKLQAINFR